MEDLIKQFCSPLILINCLCVGYIVKKWIKDVDNRLIPTIVALFGLALAVASNWGSLTIALAVGGALSGLASTGLHQMFAQWIDNGGK